MGSSILEIERLQVAVDIIRDQIFTTIQQKKDTRAFITTANARIGKLTDRIYYLKEMQKETETRLDKQA
jgi:hypothetical protein